MRQTSSPDAAPPAGPLPTLFIAGVPKAGTSTLHRWIADHPEAFGATEKEAGFFVDPGSHIFRADRNVATGWASYHALFEFPEGPAPRVVLDSTPAYIYQRAALDHIPDLPGAPRCLFVLREPAEQIRSLFGYYRNNWADIPAGMSFAEFVAAADAGRSDFAGNELLRDALGNAAYHGHLSAWRDRLGAERMRVTTVDRLRADPRGLMHEIARWLDIDPGFYDGYAFPRENATYTPRWRVLQRLNVALREALPKGAVYDRLRRLYRAANTRPGSDAAASEADLAALRARYAADRHLLERDFCLDLSAWRG